MPISNIFPKDHDVLAFGNEDGRLQIIKSVENASYGDSMEDEHESLTQLRGWTAHKNAIFDVAWKPDDSWICTASADNTCKLWDVETGKVTTTLIGPTGSVKSITFDPLNPSTLPFYGYFC